MFRRFRSFLLPLLALSLGLAACAPMPTVVPTPTELGQAGAAEEVLRLPNFWINHVLLHPTDRNRLLFCHEFGHYLAARQRGLGAGNGEAFAAPCDVHFQRGLDLAQVLVECSAQIRQPHVVNRLEK